MLPYFFNPIYSDNNHAVIHNLSDVFLLYFAAYPLVDKYMVQPYKAEQKKKNQLQEKEDGEDDDDIDFKDNL